MKAPASAALLPAPPLGSSKMPLLHRVAAAAINGHGGKCSISSVPRIEKKLEEAGGSAHAHLVIRLSSYQLCSHTLVSRTTTLKCVKGDPQKKKKASTFLYHSLATQKNSSPNGLATSIQLPLPSCQTLKHTYVQPSQSKSNLCNINKNLVYFQWLLRLNMGLLSNGMRALREPL